MRNPINSKKRALGLTLAAALTLGATVAVTTTSAEAAATTGTVTLSPKTGPANTTNPSVSSAIVLTVTGKGFQVGTTVKVGSVDFSTATCGATYAAVKPAASFAVSSPTKLVVTSNATLALSSPTAASTDYNVCVYDTTGNGTHANDKLLATGKYTVYPQASITSVNGITNAAVSGSSLGGTTLSIVGKNFSKATRVQIDGAEAKVTVLDATDLTAVTPAHAAGTGNLIKLNTEGGTVSAPGSVTFTYLPAVTVSPDSGSGAANNVITLTGSGFTNLTFDTASNLSASKTSVLAVPAGTVIADTTDLSAGAPTGSFKCGGIQVESDTSLDCQLPSMTSAYGAYTIVMLTLDSSKLVDGTKSSGYSTSATYTAATF